LAAKGGVQVSASMLWVSVAALTAGLTGGHVLAAKLGGEHARQFVIALSAIGATAIVVKGLLSW